MECNTINNHHLLVTYFTSDEENIVNRTLKCFNSEFYQEFSLFCYKYLFASRPHLKHKEEELLREAFNDGLLSFYMFIRKTNFAQRDASVKTVFFEFCKRKLLGAIKTAERELAIFIKEGSEFFSDAKDIPGGLDILAAQDEIEMNTKKEELYKTGFEALAEKCRNLIMWRKYYRLSNEAIALKAGLAPSSINNEVYKCSEKLKEKIKDLESKNIA